MQDSKSRQGIYSHYNKLNKRVILALPLIILIVIPSQLITLHLLKTLISLESLTKMEVLNYLRFLKH